MNFDLLISDLTNICIYQSEIIKAQTCALDELGIKVISEEDKKRLNELCNTIKNWRA